MIPVGGFQQENRPQSCEGEEQSLHTPSQQKVNEVMQRLRRKYEGVMSNGDANLPIVTPQKQHVYRHKPVHPVLIVIHYLFRMIWRNIVNWFTTPHQKYLSDMLFWSSSLKAQGLIGYGDYARLKDAIPDSDRLKEELENISSQLHRQRFLDLRAKKHLDSLINLGRHQDALLYLFALSSLHTLGRDHEVLNKVVLPEERAELLPALEKASQSSRFDADMTRKLTELVARAQCMHWAQQIPDQYAADRDQMIRSIQDRDQKRFQEAAEMYLMTRAASEEGVLEKLYHKELAESFRSPIYKDGFRHLSHVLQTQNTLTEWGQDLAELKAGLDELGSSEEVSPQVVQDLNQLYAMFATVVGSERRYAGSRTAFGFEEGKLRMQWRDLGQEINRRVPVLARTHAFCGCLHQSPDQVSWPDAPNSLIESSRSSESREPVNTDKKNVLILSCRLGGGHRSTTEAQAAYLGKANYHTSVVDVPIEVLLEQDPLAQRLGEDYSLTALYNTLMSGGYYGTVRLMRQLGGDAFNDEQRTVTKSLIRERILRERPDVIIANYMQHEQEILEVAEELGIPYLSTATDYDLSGGIQEGGTRYPHFKRAVPLKNEKTIRTNAGHLRDDQMVEVGYPVRKEFLKPGTPEEVAEVKKKLNIAPDEDVVLVMGGGNGQVLPWPELLANTNQGDFPKTRVIVIAGKNESFKDEVDAMVRKGGGNPDITFDVRGETDASGVREAQLVADVIVTKAGGQTSGESVNMETKMLIPAIEEGVEWEELTGDYLTEDGIATRFFNKGSFVKALQEALVRPKPDFSPYQRFDVAEKTVGLVDQMIAKAKEDPEMVRARHAWNHDLILTSPNQESKEPLNVRANLVKLSHQLKENTFNPQIGITSEAMGALSRKEPVRLDHTRGCIVSADSTSKTEDRVVLRHLLGWIKRIDWETQGEDCISERLNAAMYHLAFLVEKYRTELDKGYQENRGDDTMMEIAALDQHLVAARIRLGRIDVETFKRVYGLNVPGGVTVPLVKNLYSTTITRERFDKWVNEKTSNGRKKKIDDFMMKQADAVTAFVYHPEQVDLIHKLRLHRMASGFNHKWDINSEGEVLFRINGQQRPARELAALGLDWHRDEIISRETGKTYHYYHDVGLAPTEEQHHPVDWRGELPIYKRGQRKTQDYRLEMMSDVDGTYRDGAWYRLKTPDGRVYSVQQIRDPNYDIPSLAKLAIVPARLRAGSLRESLGTESKWTKTKVTITERQFRELKALTEEWQNTERPYEPVNHNCMEPIVEVARRVGISIDAKGTFFDAFLPSSEPLTRFYLKNKWVKDMTLVLSYPLTLLRNLFFITFGGALDNHGPKRFDDEGLFARPESFFNPFGGRPSQPAIFKVWQGIFEEKRREQTTS